MNKIIINETYHRSESKEHKELKNLATNILFNLGFKFIEQEYKVTFKRWNKEFNYIFDVFGFGYDGEGNPVKWVVECGRVNGNKLAWAYKNFDKVLWLTFDNQLLTVIPADLKPLKLTNDDKKRIIDGAFK